MFRFVTTCVFSLCVCLGAMSLVHCDGSNGQPDGGQSDAATKDEGGATSLSFPRVEVPGCKCSPGQKHETSHSPQVDDAADAVAISPNDKSMFVASKLELLIFQRESADALFTLQLHKMALPQRAWRFRFSPDGSHIALIMDRQIQVWDVAMALKDPKDAGILSIDSPGDGSANGADAAFLTNDVIAVGFYGGTAKDAVQVWRVAKGSAKPLAEAVVPAVQSLTTAPKGDLLFVGGREASDGEPRAMFTIFQWAIDGDNATLTKKKEVFLKQQNTNVTTMAVSPDNAFVAVGTSPDLAVQRSTPKPPPVGDHGYITVFATEPFDEAKGVILIPEAKAIRSHRIAIRRLAFRSDGRVLGSIGIGSPRNSALVYLWKRQDDQKKPFVLGEKIEVATPGRDMGFGRTCQYTYNASLSKPFVQMWKGCL